MDHRLSQTKFESPFFLGAALIVADCDGPGLSEQIGMTLPEATLRRILSQTRPTVVALPACAEGRASKPVACMVLPWFEHERLRHHLLVFVGEGTGTLEVWTHEFARDLRQSRLRLQSGHFGPLSEFFRLSAETRFCWGEGLPGQAAARRDCVVFEDLEQSTAFLRANAAQSVGLKSGFAFPVAHPLGIDVATILIGNPDTGACRIDTWNAGETLDHEHMFLEGSNAIQQRERAQQLAGAIARTRAPSVSTSTGSAGSWEGAGFGWIAPGCTSIPRILTVVA